MSINNLIQRNFKNLNLRLQVSSIFLSLVGVAFGIKSYLNVCSNFGSVASEPFLYDLYIQIAVALFFNIIIAIAIQMTVAKPIDNLTASMISIADNELDTNIPYTEDPSQIGRMARRVKIFRENAIEKQLMEEKQKSDDIRQAEEKRAMMNGLAQNFEDNIGGVMSKLQNATQTLGTTASSLGHIVEQTNTQVNSASEATDQASQDVQTVSASIEQLNSAIQEVSNSVDKSSNLIYSAVDTANSANTKVKSLDEAMKEISQVTTIIQDIAEQTNLLALNATIEAARAGEAGKGFAVVASEVKNLASETSKATEKIANHIDHLQRGTKEVVSAITDVTGNIEQLDQASSNIAVAIEQKRAATENIALSVEHVAGRTNIVTQSITGVSQTAKNTEQEAKNVMVSSDELKMETQNLNNSVDAFLSRIRAA